MIYIMMVYTLVAFTVILLMMGLFCVFGVTYLAWSGAQRLLTKKPLRTLLTTILGLH